MDAPSLKCGVEIPGHRPDPFHIIHAARSARRGGEQRVPATLLEVRDDGTLVIGVDDEVRLLWHHNPRRLALLAAQSDGAITLQWDWRLLWTGPHGRFPLSVCDPDDRVPCPTPPTRWSRTPR